MPDDRSYRTAFYQAVSQRDALDARQEEFYVPIYERPEMVDHDVVALMRDGIEFSVASSVQILSGFRGSGKSSELLRLRTELEAGGYTVVYMDIEDYFNTELPLQLGNFPLALAAGFADGLSSSVGGAESVFERLRSLLSRLQIDPTLSVGAGPVGVELKAALRDDASFAARVRDVMRNNRRAVRQELHQYFLDVTAEVQTDRGLVFIIDSIDHFRGRAERFAEVRESVEAAFSELADELVLPGIHAIYTVPIYIEPAIGIRRDILNIKMCEPSGAINPAGIATLRAVLERRAPGGDLARLLGDQEERTLAASGGLIRDLLRLTSEITLTARTLPVTESALLRAESTLRSNMEMTFSKEQVEILRDIARTHELTPAKDQWADATDLMAHGAILRYPNGVRPWYGVHPLLESLIT